LRVLLIATKSPWPPIGGGNVAVHHLVSALQQIGVEVMVVALGRGSGGTDQSSPYPITRVGYHPPQWWRVAHHLLLPPPPALARFRSARLLDELERVVRSASPDLIHLEQLHLAWTAPALSRRAPVLLRQQNVESLILERLARVCSGPRRLLLQREARRMARAEAVACGEVTGVAAISEPDADRLRDLAPEAAVEVVPVAFEPPPVADRPQLAGEPPLICLGSFDWLPSRDGGLWLTREIWPGLQARLPGAVLHLAGPGSRSLVTGDSDRVCRHGVVNDPQALYDPGGVVVVPVRAGSGVRLRILEAWAAGVPVVTTSVGGEGLVAADGDGAAVADTAEGFQEAVEQIASDSDLRKSLTDRGRELLHKHHPELVARRALEWYQEALSSR
jgi:glycosyltransferase involved in cell wall biosynthesis